MLVGRWLRRILPEEHLSADSRDTIKLAMGLVATKEDLETAEMYQDSEMQWSLWGGGEGVWGPMGGLVPF